MINLANSARVAAFVLVGGLTMIGEPGVGAQGATGQTAAQKPTPEGYVPRGTRPGKGLAPGMRVTDLGRGARTFRINMTKGDEILSGLTEFAEKYKIRNGRFTGLGAINRAMFGWSDVESGLGQKQIPLNQEAEIVSLVGSISMNAQGQSNVHAHGSVALSDGTVKGGHWWEAHVSIIAEIFVTEEEAPAPPKP
jgi:hypothetical protein